MNTSPMMDNRAYAIDSGKMALSRLSIINGRPNASPMIIICAVVTSSIAAILWPVPEEEEGNS